MQACRSHGGKLCLLERVRPARGCPLPVCGHEDRPEGRLRHQLWTDGEADFRFHDEGRAYGHAGGGAALQDRREAGCRKRPRGARTDGPRVRRQPEGRGEGEGRREQPVLECVHLLRAAGADRSERLPVRAGAEGSVHRQVLLRRGDSGRPTHRRAQDQRAGRERYGAGVDPGDRWRCPGPG